MTLLSSGCRTTAVPFLGEGGRGLGARLYALISLITKGYMYKLALSASFRLLIGPYLGTTVHADTHSYSGKNSSFRYI